MSLIVEHNGKTWEVDYGGFRADVTTFDLASDDDWYDYVRIKYRIPELTSEHITVLEFYQDYFRKNGLSAPLNIAAKELNKSKEEIIKLFHSDNPLKTIIVMAGLPRPTAPCMPDKGLGWVKKE